VSRFHWDQRPRLCKLFEDLSSFDNSLILCDFVVNRAGKDYNYPRIREALFAVTGRSLAPEEMVLVGERNYMLLRLYSALCGYRRKDDVLPKRFEEPLGRGASAGESLARDVMDEQVSKYYEERGWDEWGPTRERLVAVGLGDLALRVPPNAEREVGRP
ncbi:MAG: aldehyde ferredoxin oxidoreductase C-terminal domain-containing protein, partial [Candidatus Bipolaricaulis sp.]|nr:aldehyde ferredoxin oxidoreductase C-terminal domain-containing protein [Candidatus Bipolaricaulis sp.]